MRESVATRERRLRGGVFVLPPSSRGRMRPSCGEGRPPPTPTIFGGHVGELHGPAEGAIARNAEVVECWATLVAWRYMGAP
jgi:hypothetical protein